MFQALDATIRKTLEKELDGAVVSFETPTSTYEPENPTVNLFLIEVRENVRLRNPLPVKVRSDGEPVLLPAPLRLDCVYLVTAWADKNHVGDTKVAKEHELLGKALKELSAMKMIPQSEFDGGDLANQPFPVPVQLAQAEESYDLGKFWSALGVLPRPSFTVVATIALVFGPELEQAPLPKDVILRTRQKHVEPEETLEVSGLVTAAGAGQPLADAQVAIVELEWSSQTDEKGRFRFSYVASGSYTLRVERKGYETKEKQIKAPGEAGAYDVELRPIP